jgi:malate dehydrogenase (quinone)
MLELLQRCFADRWEEWQPTLRQLVPSLGTQLASDPESARETLTRTARALGLATPSSEDASSEIRSA